MTAVFLCIFLLAGLFPTGTAAAGAIPRTPGRVPGIDYSRIQPNVTLRRPVEINIGDRVFSGYLQNGATLTNEEVDAAIREVMAEQELTEDKLFYMYSVIAQAAKSTGFDPEIIYKLGMAFAAGATGIDNAAAVYDVVVKGTDPVAVGANIALGSLIGKAAKQVFVKNIYTMVVSGLWNCTQPLG